MKQYEVLILFLLILPLSQTQVQTEFQTMGTRKQFATAQLQDNDINIGNNTDFITQGWPGGGTSIFPYRLENLRIFVGSGFYGNIPIRIWNTDAFFIIKNCTFVLLSYAYGRAIQLLNVTHGEITNCTITTTDYSSYSGGNLIGIDMIQSSLIDVSDCVIIGCSIGVQIDSCTRCFVHQSTFRDQRQTGIQVDLSNYTDVGLNVITGTESHRTETGIYVLIDCLDCSIFSNTIDGFWTGIQTQGLIHGDIYGNKVTQSDAGILLEDTNNSRVTWNVLADNHYGLFVASDSSQNAITNNTFGDNTEVDAEDDGAGNSWASNWYSGYSGIGTFTIPGSANSVDTSPLPHALHLPALIDTLTILLLIGLIPFGAGIGYCMRWQERKGKKAYRGLSLFFMVLSVLIPCGISIAPRTSSLFPHLKYFLVDVLFTLGISRSPGTDWSVGFYSSSFVSANDQLLLVSIPYLVACVLSIVLLMGYLRNDIGGKLFGLGTIIVLTVVMLVPLTASVLLVPVTPLLSLSIAFWRNKMKLETSKQDINV